jgi:signal transduction histidine kinase
VAHELNNPLQGVMGHIELLIEAEDRPHTLYELREIRDAGDRAAKIVRNLLTFARRSALERSVADLNEIVRSTLTLRASDVRARNMVIEEHYSNDLPLIIVNREEIQQIVLNLMLNAEHALRATGEPGRIRLTTRVSDDADAVVFEIADEGPGIPHDVASRIFEPFFTTKLAGEGTGLGLSVSLGIAEAHGGSLALLPAERGARFALTLPMASMQSLSNADLTVAY